MELEKDKMKLEKKKKQNIWGDLKKAWGKNKRNAQN